MVFNNFLGSTSLSDVWSQPPGLESPDNKDYEPSNGLLNGVTKTQRTYNHIRMKEAFWTVIFCPFSFLFLTLFRNFPFAICNSGCTNDLVLFTVAVTKIR